MVRFTEWPGKTGKGAMEWYFRLTITEVNQRRLKDLLKQDDKGRSRKKLCR